MICSAFYSPHIGSYALNFSSVARCAKELDTPTANFLLLEIGIAVNLLPCHYTLSHLKPEDMQRQNKFTSPNLPKCIIPPTLHSHFIHLSPTSYHVSNWQRQYIQHSSLSLSLSHSICMLHSETHLAHLMFPVSEVTARIQICSAVINGLRVLQREQISVSCVMIFNLHSMSHAVESVLLAPFSTHNIPRHYPVLQPDTLGREK